MTDKYDFIEDVAKISSLEIFGIDSCVSWEDLFKSHLCYDASCIEPCCPPESSLSDSKGIEEYFLRKASSERSIYEYKLTVPPRLFGEPGGRVDYIDENGDAKFKAWLQCSDSRNCHSFSIVFCAQYGSIRGTTSSGGITPEGAVIHAFNEPCPVNAIQCVSDPGLERLNDC
jgi:hypothetical protein